MKKILVIIISVLIALSFTFIGHICYQTSISKNEIIKLFNTNEDIIIKNEKTFREKSLVNGFSIFFASKKVYDNYVVASVEFEDDNDIDDFLKANFYSSNIYNEQYMEFSESLKKHIEKYHLDWISTEINHDFKLYITSDCCDPATVKSSSYYYCLKFQKKAILIYDQSFLNL